MSDVLRGPFRDHKSSLSRKVMLRVGINVSFKMVPHFPPSAKYWWSYINSTDFFRDFFVQMHNVRSIKRRGMDVII